MITWEAYIAALEEDAEFECRNHRKRMGLPEEEENTDEAMDCSEKACRQGCPLLREPQDD